MGCGMVPTKGVCGDYTRALINIDGVHENSWNDLIRSENS